MTLFASFLGGYFPHFHTVQVHHSPGQRSSTFGASMGLQFGYLQPDSSKTKSFKTRAVIYSILIVFEIIHCLFVIWSTIKKLFKYTPIHSQVHTI